MKCFIIVTVLVFVVVAVVRSEDTKDRSAYGGASAGAPGTITFQSGGLAGGSAYGGNAATAPASISFHTGGLNNAATILKVESGTSNAVAPAVISIPGGGIINGAALSAFPCPKNYLFSCQPSLQAAPCGHAFGSYGGVGAYSENHPVYASHVPQYVEGYRRN